MKKVLIIYRFLPHYRVDFYNRLKEALSRYNVDLQLIYGKSKNSDAQKKDEMDLEWGNYIPNRYFRFGKIELLWQPCLKYLKDKDLIIVEGANKLILNYFLMLARHFYRFKLGIWGHGRNMQLDKNDVRNKYKYMFLDRCDYYFAYTTGVKSFLISRGLNPQKIFVVQNAIDTVELSRRYSEIDNAEATELKNQLGLTGSNICIYCGGMYPEKRIDFLIEACHRIKEKIDDFEILFIGSGIDAPIVIKASEENDWIHYIGPKLGLDRVKYFKISKLHLMPGLVGLGILDSFALETPIITTDYPYHSPEIEYLENDINGIITNDNISDYSNTVIEILRSKKYLDLLEGCKLSSGKYTVESMVENFKNGILSCI